MATRIQKKNHTKDTNFAPEMMHCITKTALASVFGVSEQTIYFWLNSKIGGVPAYDDLIRKFNPDFPYSPVHVVRGKYYYVWEEVAEYLEKYQHRIPKREPQDFELHYLEVWRVQRPSNSFENQLDEFEKNVALKAKSQMLEANLQDLLDKQKEITAEIEQLLSTFRESV